MSIGYTKPLYILAFDHRNTFAKHIFNTKLQDLTSEQKQKICLWKEIIYQGFLDALQKGVSKDNAAILIDEEFGDKVLQDAMKNNNTILLAAEKSGSENLELAYQDFGAHIEKYHPTFVKILITYGLEDAPEKKKSQQEILRIVCDYCRKNDYKFLLEVLIKVSDEKTRGAQTTRMIEQLQQAGAEPDVWKLEGLDEKADYEMVVAQAKSGGRNDVGVVFLGRGADSEKVTKWLLTGREVWGIIGFAVGRTIFWDSIQKLHTDSITSQQAVHTISENFSKFCSVFEKGI